MLGEDAEDRLDAAEAGPMLVDERYVRVRGRSSSAAKKDAAAFRMSLALFSSAILGTVAGACAGTGILARVAERTMPDAGAALVLPDL
ncbi:hypothetical protein ACH4C6_34405 [Streptomyces sp. NPDC017943]|uniref:hypothetical protein n=1 Tax=Streptomyces sp. NPDC017943 TaxID=3365019 RepID=UPI00379F6606